MAGRLAEGEGAHLPVCERACGLGAEAASAIDAVLGTGSSTDLVEALTGFRELEREGERWSATEVTLLAIRGELDSLRDELEEHGHARALLDVMGVSHLCELLGFSRHMGKVIARVTRHVRLHEPAVRAVFCASLAAGTPLSVIDQVRRLVPVGIRAAAAERRIEELARSSSRQLGNAARHLLATRRPGELEGGASARGRRDDARASGEPPGDPDPTHDLLSPSYLDWLRRQDPDLAAEIDAAASTRTGRALLSCHCRADVFLRLRQALGERAGRYELPGPTAALRTAFDDEASLHGLLADFLTVLHPERRRRRAPGLPAGLEAAGQDAIVRTLCPDCAADAGDEIKVIVERLRQRGRLTRGVIPETIRQLVFARAGGLCEVPSCSRPLEELHHLDPQRLRKNHDPARLLGVCRLHHHRCIELAPGHPHRIEVSGCAPDRLTFVFPGGRMVETAGAPPTSWQIVRRLREEGETGDLILGSIQSLAFPERGARPGSLRPRPRHAVGRVRDRTRPIVPHRPQVLDIVEGIWMRHLAEAGSGAAVYELTRASDGAGDASPAEGGARAPDTPEDSGPDAAPPQPGRAGYSSLEDLGDGMLDLGPTAISERRTIGRARRLYPRCSETHLVTRGCKKQLLAITRSGVDPRFDELLAYLMPYVTVRTMEDVLDQLTTGSEDPRVRWSISLSEETRHLFQRAALEVRRAHGASMSLDEVIEFILEADWRGVWPEIPERPFEAEGSLGAPSMERRIGAPSFATSTLECAHCGLLWQQGRRGELVFPGPDRIREIRSSAGAPGRPRVRMLPGALDTRFESVHAEQPRPEVEMAALGRDGGCRVPDCPHSRDSRSRAEKTGARVRPQALRALAIRMLAGRASPGADLRELDVDDLITLCPDHQRAVWRGRIRLDGDCAGRARFRVDMTALADRRTRKWLKTREKRRDRLDLADLVQRVARLEGCPPPT